MSPILTRFAPSPTGLLHLGHAYAALRARIGASDSMDFYLRMDDLDQTRARDCYESTVLEDMAWLGLSWNPKVRKQSQHFFEYQNALAKLKCLGLVYPCFCTRKEIQEEVARAGNAPHGPSGILYPAICKKHSEEQRALWISEGKDFSLRLDVAKAWKLIGKEITYTDLAFGTEVADPRPLGDIVLARKDTPTSYHLAVVIDDHAQGITRVTRGKDLLHVTSLHRVLQELLELNVPEWHHHELIPDENGVRLAKSSNATSLQALRGQGWTSEKVIHHLAQLTQDSSILSLVP